MIADKTTAMRIAMKLKLQRDRRTKEQRQKRFNHKGSVKGNTLR